MFCEIPWEYVASVCVCVRVASFTLSPCRAGVVMQRLMITPFTPNLKPQFQAEKEAAKAKAKAEKEAADKAKAEHRDQGGLFMEKIAKTFA